MKQRGKNGRLKSCIDKMKMVLKKPLPGRQAPIGPARDRIVGRFETWLDDVLAEEKPLEGFDAELLSELEVETDVHMKGVSGNQNNTYATNDTYATNNTYATNDTYATWGAMTALTQEIKLQGRAFRELKNDLAPLSTLGSTLGPSLDNLSAAHRDAVSDAGKVADLAHTVLADRKKALRTEADLRARNEVLNVLLDTRERLIIGLKSTEESRLELESGVTKNWFRKRRTGKKADIMQAVDIILSLKKGYRLGLERLDETILKWGVAEIPCQGKPFDPNLMTAVDMEEREDILDGTVVEVFRTGYTLNHETLRPAQVKVARAPMNPKEKI